MKHEKKILDLIDIINDHNYKYYVLDDPIISDGEFDNLFKELKKNRNKDNYFINCALTQKNYNTQNNADMRTKALVSENNSLYPAIHAVISSCLAFMQWNYKEKTFTVR